MELRKWEKKFISRNIRKDRKITFKHKVFIWAILSNIFALIMIFYLVKGNTEYLSLLSILLVVSLSFCSINALCSIIRKYDNKFNGEFEI